MRTKKLLATSVILIFLGASMAQAQSAEDIMNHYIEASGGRQAYENTQKMTYRMESSFFGTPVSLSIEHEYPNKKTSITSVKGKQTKYEEYNGEKGYIIENEKKRAYNEKEQRHAEYGNILFKEVYYKDYNITVEYIGKEKIKKQKGMFHKIKYNMPNGSYSYAYFDVDTGMLVKEENEDSSFILYSDFRNYKGFTLPYHFVIGAGKFKMKAQVKEVEIHSKSD